MLRELFSNFSVLVTLTVLISFVATATAQHSGTWERRLLFWLAASLCGLIIMQFGIPVANGVALDFRTVVTALAGLYGGPVFAVAVGVPLVLYRWLLGGPGTSAGVLSIAICSVVAGLLRIGSSTFYEKSIRKVIWRGALIFAIAHATFLLVPGQGLHLFRAYWPVQVVAQTVGLATCIFILQVRLSVQRNLVEATVMANTDDLTGLPNQRAFQLALRSSDAFRGCLLIVDVDHFKRINDTFGHPVGDEVLKGLAIVLRREIRMQDLAFRCGGEEFAVLLYGCSLPEGIHTADRLRRAVDEWQLWAPPLPAIHVTISGGIVPVQPEIPAAELLMTADQLLYHAKHAGRNRIAAPQRPPEDPHFVARTGD